MSSAIPERVLPRPALSIAQLTKKYVVHGGYEVPALRGVSLDLYPGEMVGLFGSNGAGKTTLVRIVAGLLSADSGDVAWGSPEGRSCLGYVSQKGGLQYGLTCREEMTFHAQCFGQSARQARSSVDAVAAMLNCGYLMDWDVGRLCVRRPGRSRPSLARSSAYQHHSSAGRCVGHASPHRETGPQRSAGGGQGRCQPGPTRTQAPAASVRPLCW